MRFDLTDLKLFLHVVESGSITAGAARTHLALASASARIQGMEDALGSPLLLRSRRGVEPTDAGRTLLHHARSITLQIEKMRADLGEYASGLKGYIRLLCNTSALTEFLPDVMANFMAHHPQINIDLEERPSQEIVQAIRDKLADIGIVTDAVDNSGLETRPFREEKLVLALSSSHPLLAEIQGQSALPFAATLLYDFIGLPKDSALQKHVAGHASKLGSQLRYRVRVRSFDAVCRMVASGVGLAVLPESAVMRSRDSEKLQVIQLTDAWAKRQLLLCMQNYADLPGYAQNLVDALSQQPVIPVITD